MKCVRCALVIHDNEPQVGVAGLHVDCIPALSRELAEARRDVQALTALLVRVERRVGVTYGEH